ncbi:hypothetical protein KKP97_00470 [Methanothermococcus sp. SCGC AD-155-C09]|nr:hypothetical protein [Methanothermococcus sp. SCGC AD-155-C09]
MPLVILDCTDIRDLNPFKKKKNLKNKPYNEWDYNKRILFRYENDDSN